MTSRIVLVSGPVRSGKSDYAEELTKAASEEAAAATGVSPEELVAYVATAEAGDQEMASRIAAHQARRPRAWLTKEAPFHPALAIQEAYAAGRRVLLLDCLTMLVSNWLCRLLPEEEQEQLLEQDYFNAMAQPVEEMLALIRSLEDVTLVMVTDEVGWGLVPDNALGRLYRDLAGRINRQAAAAADQAWLVVMGLPQQLK
ncbi:MAG: bifunctional adenosylcobinamide kinase/adenosylcobinamide-phosphate guanylyltransferase [Clostridiales bacterium]